MNLNEIYQKYKVGSCYGVGSDKGTSHSYIEVYESLLSKYVGKSAMLLEIGVASGASLLMWEEYLENGTIHGIDIVQKPKLLFGHESIKYYTMNIRNRVRVESEFGLSYFNVIIDDGSHYISDQIFAINILWKSLKPGGIYIVEDIIRIENTERFKEFGAANVFDLRKNKGRIDDILISIEKGA